MRLARVVRDAWLVIFAVLGIGVAVRSPGSKEVAFAAFGMLLCVLYFALGTMATVRSMEPSQRARLAVAIVPAFLMALVNGGLGSWIFSNGSFANLPVYLLAWVVVAFVGAAVVAVQSRRRTHPRRD
jgi:hypothetical protein